MRLEGTNVLASIMAIALASGCGHKSQTYIPGTALGAAATVQSRTPAEPVAPVFPDATPASRFLYTANPAAGTISVVGFDREANAFKPVGDPVSTGGSAPWALAADPAGRFLYCVNRGSNDISAFTIDPESGYLKQVTAGAPIPAPPLPKPGAPRLLDKKVAWTPFFSITSLIFEVEVPVQEAARPATLKVATGGAPTAIAIAPDGTRLVVVNRFDATLGSYTIDPSSGMLRKANVLLFDRKQVPTDVAFDPVVADRLFVCGGPDGFAGTVQIDRTGYMKQTGTAVKVGDAPVAMSVDPKGARVAIVCHPANTLTTFAPNEKGQLAVRGEPIALGADPSAVVFDPTGSFAFVTAKNAGRLLSYVFDPEGVRAADAPVSAGVAPTDVAVDASGKLVYTASSGEAALTVFQVHPLTHAARSGLPVVLPVAAEGGATLAASSAGRGPRAVIAVR